MVEYDSMDMEQTVVAVDLPADGGIGDVDRYRLIRKLGSGGFGSVYLALDKVADIEVALKVLPPLLSSSDEELARVKSNFKLVEKLHHPNIITLKYLHKIESIDLQAERELKVSNDGYLLVMEYVSGFTISSWRHRFPNGKVPFDKAIAICQSVATALDYAHSQRIIHRDVKPSNVMLSEGKDVKVLDFGLAAEIRSSMSRVSQEQVDSSGTRPYMSPEQWMGKRQGAYSDQYALAVMFYELLIGEPPFQSVFETNDVALIRDVIKTETSETIASLSISQNRVLQKALSKNYQERFSSCGSFINALKTGKMSSDIISQPPPPPRAIPPTPSPLVTSRKPEKPVVVPPKKSEVIAEIAVDSTSSRIFKHANNGSDPKVKIAGEKYKVHFVDAMQPIVYVNKQAVAITRDSANPNTISFLVAGKKAEIVVGSNHKRDMASYISKSILKLIILTIITYASTIFLRMFFDTIDRMIHGADLLLMSTYLVSIAIVAILSWRLLGKMFGPYRKNPTNYTLKIHD